MNVQLPEYAEPLIDQWYRYTVFRGGRGSAKSYTIAKLLLLFGKQERRRVLCAREFQNSMAESVHKLLCDQVDEMKLNNVYQYNSTSVWNKKNGTEFIFKGVRMNVQSIKSMVGITDLWLEEADTVSQSSWDVLVPTIRAPGSRIWVSYNPNEEDDPTHVKFTKNIPPETLIIDVNWDRNPWFPEVLQKEKDEMYRTDPDLAAHVWGGECRKNSDKQIFRGKYVVREFEIDKDNWDGPYQGADFGFSQDPSTGVQVWLDLPNRELLVRYEVWGKGVTMDALPAFYRSIPGFDEHRSRGDSARPETVNHLHMHGIPMESVEKWTGSVEDGIEWMKSFDRIVIHPDCPKTIEEMKKYSYKVDRLTQLVLTDVVDDWNHCIDAIRYACCPLIQAGRAGILAGI